MFKGVFILKNIFGIKSAKAVLTGAASAILLSVVMIFILAWILFSSSLSEKVSDAAVLAITIASAFFAGFLCARINKANGMILGLVSGLMYLVMIYVISCFLGMRADFSTVCVSTAVLSLICAAIGGILGVNIKRKQK